MATYYVRTAGGNSNVAATYSLDGTLKAAGAAAATTPGTSDDVVLTSASGSFTQATAMSIRNFICEDGYAGTLNIQSLTMTLSGTILTLSSQLMLTGAGGFATTGAITITANGKLIPALSSGASGTSVITLGGPLTVVGNFVINGGLVTNNHALQASALNTTNPSTRTWALGTSVVTLTSTVPFGISATNAVGLTVQSSAATLVLTNTGSTAYTTPSTYSWAALTCSNPSTLSFTSSVTVTGAFVRRKSVSGSTTTQSVGVVVTCGSFDAGNGSGNEPMRWQSAVTGTVVSLVIAGTSTATQISFRDVAVTGAASPISGTKLGDAGGNSGVTFTASRTLYRVGTTAAAWFTSNRWATSRGGAGSEGWPLPQDDCIVPGGTGAITTAGALNLCRNLVIENGASFSVTSSAATIYGDFTVETGGTTVNSSSLSLNFGKRGSDAIFTGIAPGISLSTNSASVVRCANGTNSQTRNISQNGGGEFVIPANTEHVCRAYDAGSSTLTRALRIGAGGKLRLRGLGGTQNLFLSNAGSGFAQDVDPAGVIELDIDTAGTYTIASTRAMGGTLLFEKTPPASTFIRMNNSTATWERIVITGSGKVFEPNGGLNAKTYNVLGTDAANPVIFRGFASGTRRTLNSYLKAASTWRYVTIQDIGLPVGQETVAYDSTDGGNNLGFTFEATPPPVGQNLVFLDGVGYEPWYDGTKMEAWYDGVKY